MISDSFVASLQASRFAQSANGLKLKFAGALSSHVHSYFVLFLSVILVIASLADVKSDDSHFFMVVELLFVDTI
jgi:hypothetical protein